MQDQNKRSAQYKLGQKITTTKGFTLAELLVVLILLSLLLTFFLQCFFFVMHQYQGRMALLELDDNLSIGIEHIAANGANSVAVTGCNTDVLVMKYVIGTTENTVRYAIGTDTQADLHLYDLTGKVLRFRKGPTGKQEPIANFISDFRVTYYDHMGNVTTEIDRVHAVDVQLEGQWNNTTIQKRRVIRLKTSNYL